MSRIDQPSFEAGLQTAVDLANAVATRLEMDEAKTPRHTDGAAHIRAYADAIQALLDAQEADPVGYTVRMISESP